MINPVSGRPLRRRFFPLGGRPLQITCPFWRSPLLCPYSTFVASPLVLNISRFFSDNALWQFTTETLRNLDHAIKDHYDEWWEGAPDSYRVPEFIDAEPVAILAKYGQNIKICDPGTFEADRNAWNEMIDFNNILRIHMAYAVHTQCVLTPSSHSCPPI